MEHPVLQSGETTDKHSGHAYTANEGVTGTLGDMLLLSAIQLR